MSPVRVLVVDDQETFRRAAVAVVGATAGFVVAATAGSGEEALGIASAGRLDLVLMDVELPGMDGVAAAAELGRRGHAPFVVLLSTYDEEEVRERVAGAPGAVYLPKARLAPDRLVSLWARRPVPPGAAG